MCNNNRKRKWTETLKRSKIGLFLSSCLFDQVIEYTTPSEVLKKITQKKKKNVGIWQMDTMFSYLLGNQRQFVLPSA